MVYLISQLFASCAFLMSLIAYHRKDKKCILKNMILSNIFNLTHYFLLGAFSGCITKSLAIFRDCVVIQKEKNKKLSKKRYLFIFIVLYIIASIITYNGIISIMPFIAALTYIIFIWNGNEIQIKKVALFSYVLWLLYNIFVYSLIGIISNSISIISTLIAINTNNKYK